MSVDRHEVRHRSRCLLPCANRPAAALAEALEVRTLFAFTPNDPSFASQYALANAAFPDAWSTTRGSAAVVVADIDTGADYTHPDLSNNIWINQAEIPTSVRSKLKDADGDARITFYDLNASANRALMKDVNANGRIDPGDLLTSTGQGGWQDGVNGKSNVNDKYTDDIVGWDFAENDNKPFDDGTANFGHGTHTAGILGAVGNNGVGISGAVMRTSMIIARIFGDAGNSTTDARIAESIRYTADNGARVANASWGGGGGFAGDAMHAAIKYAGTKGQLFVAAAGNNGRNLDPSTFNFYPAEYALDNVLVVSSVTSAGALSSFSNYGAAKSDVAAGGSSVYSTLPGNRYGYLSGTSMAAPLVSGAAALMLSANRSLTAAQLKAQLINGSDETTALRDRSVSDGKLNVHNALLNRAGVNLAAVAGSGTKAGTTTTSNGRATSAAGVASFTGPSFTRSFFSDERVGANS